MRGLRNCKEVLNPRGMEKNGEEGFVWRDTNCLLGVSSFGEEKNVVDINLCVLLLLCVMMSTFLQLSALLQPLGSASPCHRLFFSA